MKADISWNGISDFRLFGPKTVLDGPMTVSLSEAVKFYKNESSLDMGNECWEKYRVLILEWGLKEKWERIFATANSYAKQAFEASPQAQKLAVALGVEKEVFMADLPCSGAAMERLILSDWKSSFFNQALAIWNAGYWVCGFLNGTFIICGDVHE